MPAINAHLRFSLLGAAFLIRAEGWEEAAYQDSAGHLTIGVGHKLTRSELSSGKLLIGGQPHRWESPLRPAQILDLLQDDVSASERALRDAITVRLAQHQYDALVSFVFNIGAGAFRASTLRRLLNDGLYADVPAQLRRWVHAAGKVLPGLQNRRELEARLWQGRL